MDKDQVPEWVGIFARNRFGRVLLAAKRGHELELGLVAPLLRLLHPDEKASVTALRELDAELDPLEKGTPA